MQSTMGQRLPNHYTEPDSSLQSWLEQRLQEVAPVYWLHDNLLQQENSLRQLLGLDRAQMQAEQEFAAYCRRANAVGYGSGGYIHYRLLAPRNPPMDEQWLRELGFSSEKLMAVRATESASDSNTDRSKASVGRRMARPDYLQDRDRLKADWLALPPTERPGFPLNRPIATSALPTAYQSVELTPSAQEFAAALAVFCDRWELIGMVNWELPDPQGPHWPDYRHTPSDSNSTLLSTPIFHAVVGDDHLGRCGLQGARSTVCRDGD